MKKLKFSDTQIVPILKEAEAGMPVGCELLFCAQTRENSKSYRIL
jgi:hypothetical protein